MILKYRSVETVRAIQFVDGMDIITQLKQIGKRDCVLRQGRFHYFFDGQLRIKLEKGDYIIVNDDNSLYPVQKKFFEARYELMPEDEE